MQFDAVAGWQYTSAGDVLLNVAAVGALKVRGSYPGASCSTKPDHALQTPQTEWTNLIVVRGIVLIFGHRHHLVAGRENIPTQPLLRRIFSSSNWKRAQYSVKRALEPNGCLAGRSSANIRKGIMNCHQATVRAESALPSTADMARVIRPPSRRGRDIRKL
jgi:hypothetical protein